MNTETKPAIASLAPVTSDAQRVDAKRALWVSLAWAIPMFSLTLFAVICKSSKYQISLETYSALRYVLVFFLVVMSVAGIHTAWKFIGGVATDPKWYSNGFLVGTVIFWAIAPPVWFFTEYLLFDNGLIALPEEITCVFDKTLDTIKQGAKCISDRKEQHLKQVKAYADLASKIWAAVGAALGLSIAAARK